MEKSCGCIIVKNNKVLLIKQVKGHWGFPKGHVENTETELETADREVQEEVGIKVEIDPNRRHVMHYYTDTGVYKEVVLYLASPKSMDIKVQEEEVTEYRWVSVEEALSILTYDNFKEALTDLVR